MKISLCLPTSLNKLISAKGLCLLLLLICPLLHQAQHTSDKQQLKTKFPEEFTHNANRLFDWFAVENALALELGTSPAECNGFFNYLRKTNKLNYSAYLRQVEAGTITKDNALQYWLNQVPAFKTLYQQELQAYNTAQKAASQPFDPNTGGAVCNNLDVGNGTLSGWAGAWNDNAGVDPSNNWYGLINNNTLNSGGFNSMGFVHELCTAGADPDVPAISRVAPGHTYSVRLGTDAANYAYNHQTISNTFNVTALNNTVTYWYAVVFDQTPGGPHLQPDQPFFKIRMYDGSGNEIMCAHYDVDATGGASIGGFQTATINSGVNAGYQAVYKNWSQVMIPLINYVGQNVTVKFETSDCNAGGHFGYAYVAVDCAPFQVIQSTPFLCNGGTATMTAPAGAGTYSWSGPGIVGSNTTPAITINTPGSYTVTMTTIGNSGAVCTFDIDTIITQSINIPTAAFTNNVPCKGAITNFTDASFTGINSWSWDLGDGTTSTSQNPTHTYANAGTFNVTLIVSNSSGCFDTIVQPVVVNPLPVAAFSTTPVCTGTATTFTNTSTPNTSSYSWNYGDNNNNTSTSANPSHSYTLAATYNVQLVVTAPGGCKDSITQAIVVNANPVPAFTTTSVCAGTATTFTNTTPANPVVTNWAWDFDNNGTTDNTTASPSYTYPAAGTFTAVLTASTSSVPACTATFNALVVVHPNPVSSFTVTTVCEGAPTVFDNSASSIAAPDNIAFYNWTYGDGNNQSGQNPSHTYAACGTYNANLVVVSNNNCTNSSTVAVTVNCNPVPLFTAPTVCFGFPTVFTSQSAISTGTITNWCWDLDGNPATCELPNQAGPLSYTSPVAGTQNITLTVTSNNGCPKSITLPVTVNPKPIAAFTSSDVCNGVPVTFTNTTPGGTQTSAWDYTSDGTIDAVTSPATTTFAGSNSYNVTLYTTDQNNCKDTVVQAVNVYPNPTASFSYTGVCFNTATPLTDNSSVTANPGGNIINGWAWDFDGNATTDATVQNPTHVFPAFGSTSVNLIVTTNHGCKDTVLIPIFVNPNPVVNFSAPGVCLHVPTAFTNTSTVALGAISGWAWDYTNNGSIDNTTLAPSYTYGTPGIYTVQLTATSDSGCITSLTLPTEVYPLPLADFSYSHTCAGNPTAFTNHSTISSGSITNYNWDFDNNGTSDNNTAAPSFLFATSGINLVHLSVLSDHACADDTVKPIYINPNPVPTVAVDDPDGCPVHHANLSGGVSPASVDHVNSIVKWQWDVDNNGSLEFTNNYNPGTSTDLVAYDYINNDPVNSQIYTVHLTVTSDSGCVGSFTTPAPFITVFPHPLPGFSWGPTDPLPDLFSPLVHFNNEAVGANSMSWNFGDIHVTDPGLNVSVLFNPSHTYEYFNSSISYYDVWQWVSNTYGCKDSVMHQVEILPNWTFYIPNAFTPNDDGVNDGFRGTGININSYNLWIYDRWGNMIFYSNDLDQYWDGKVQGHDEIVQEDVYVWKVKFKDVFNQKHDRVGTVTAVR